MRRQLNSATVSWTVDATNFSSFS